MKNKISAAFAIIIFFALSKSCISDYKKGGDKAAIAKYEKMLEDNSKTTAELRDTYREVTVKIMKVPVKTYEFKYDYKVNETSYSGEHSFSELPTSKYLEVYYMKEDHSVSCVNPQSLLASENQKNTSKEPLYWGIGFGVLCVFSIFGLVAELRGKSLD
ncbi:MULTISPECIES: hypothetical protein [Niastella]|uniref:DUF3592 domain-containing protein n=1 Tax=Niastella soli TaxID=2821487 RepID=A0ABS3YVM2_9BACT|nr:hypothetical protein [Niastella soli]MBO9201952.1 hypothetical protein [Niastella soli]